MVGFKPTDVPPTAAVKFVGAGTAACIADLFTFPLDTAKVRLQIQGEGRALSGGAKVAQYRGVFGTISTMVKTEGPRSLYNGLVAGLQRQMSFASVRIGLYDSVKQFYTKGSEHVGIGSRLLAGCTTGAMAVAIAQPTDVVKVRFQAQANVAGGSRRYKGTMEAYKTIAKEEGVKGLWKGTAPNITRNAIVNCTELVTYDLIKDMLLNSNLMTDTLPCHFTSAFGAGFCTTVIASPVDVVKTRYMNSAPGQYGSALNCALTMFRKEGPQAFYKGTKSRTRDFCTGLNLYQVHALVLATGFMERGHVRHLRAAEAGHDAGSWFLVEPALNMLSSPLWARCPVEHT